MHPQQSIILDENNVPRFKENAIVRWMLNMGRQGKQFDLNSIAENKFSDNDQSQLAQLIGYSVSEYGDLDYANKSVITESDILVEKLIQNKK